MSDEIRTPISEVLLFKGRENDPRIGEWVKPVDAPPAASGKTESIILLGCPDDQGVILNRGRAGTKEGPDSIRKHFYKMTLPMDLAWEKAIALYDLGNIAPTPQIKETHRRSHLIVEQIAQRDCTVIALGGGHDFGAPNFLGFTAGRRVSSKRSEKFGLLNVDPHMDVRELEDGQPNSGTPFRQILESGRLEGKYFVEFGIRPNRNSRDHFRYCEKHGVTVRTFEELRDKKESAHAQYGKELDRLAKSCTSIGATFDMDSCSDSEGVSSAPVLGFTAWELCKMAESAGTQPKVRFFEIVEVAPALDFSERSSRIAAEMIYFFIRARALSRM